MELIDAPEQPTFLNGIELPNGFSRGVIDFYPLDSERDVVVARDAEQFAYLDDCNGLRVASLPAENCLAINQHEIDLDSLPRTRAVLMSMADRYTAGPDVGLYIAEREDGGA